MKIGDTVKFVSKRKQDDKRNFEHSARVDIAYPLWTLNGKTGTLVDIKVKKGVRENIVSLYVKTDKGIYLVSPWDVE